MANVNMDFLGLSPRELDTFIARNLQPDTAFHEQCGRDVDYLVKYLQNESGLPVAQVVKGGSLAKGTGIKGMSDLDIVVFMNNFRGFEHFKANVKSNLRVLEEKVSQWASGNGWQKVEVEGLTGHAIKLRIRKRKAEDFVDVDLLPSTDLLHNQRKDVLYQNMGRETEKDREYFSSALVPLQVEFVKRKADNAKVKNLIRLVKYWRKTQFQERSYPKLPTSYVLELATIYAWEMAGRPSSFNTAKAFKSIMAILKDYQNINIKWTENYSQPQVFKNSHQPYILDPANPYNNVCARFDAWHEVAQVANSSMQMPLLKSVDITKRMGNHAYVWQ